MRIGWNDLRDPKSAGEYPFRDGVVSVTAEQIDLWIAAPAGYFEAAPDRLSKPGAVRYLLGEFYAPST